MSIFNFTQPSEEDQEESIPDADKNQPLSSQDIKQKVSPQSPSAVDNRERVPFFKRKPVSSRVEKTLSETPSGSPGREWKTG